MIAIDHSGKLVTVTVLGEFVLADYKEFEDMVRAALAPGGKVSLFFDLRQMAGFTLDVAWEDIKYTRSHPNDFDKIAVVTRSEWVIWSAWLSQMFITADLRVFDDDLEARGWLEQEIAEE
ncbi:MAG: STAS/SEC14 domain-containing protein [Burkholderiales bacterium]|nr:STAS/SEC14 domain-containing protein [Burkholderiales bacterium]